MGVRFAVWSCLLAQVDEHGCLPTRSEYYSAPWAGKFKHLNFDAPKCGKYNGFNGRNGNGVS